MNDYRMTYTSVHAEEPQTCIVTERNEAAARKYFNAAHKGMGHTLTGAELIRENTCATKDQEREALAKIKAMVEELGPNSYLRTAFDGCFEDAENNIENDFGDSWKARAEHYDAEMTEAQKTVNDRGAEDRGRTQGADQEHGGVPGCHSEQGQEPGGGIGGRPPPLRSDMAL